MQVRTKNSWCLGISLLIFSIELCSSLIINEIELNPSGSDSGKEWIELYSENQVNLEEYTIKNNDGDEIKLNGSFSGYYVYVFSKQWLDNSEEIEYLYKSDQIEHQTDLLSDSKNDDLTWSYCGSVWNFGNSTKNEENFCEENVEQNSKIENKNNSYVTDSDKRNIQNNSIEDESYIEDEEIIVYDFRNLSYETDGIIKNNSNSEEVIYLNPKSIKSSENNEILFESKQERIKKYAIYAFALFCIGIIILLLIDKKNG